MSKQIKLYAWGMAALLATTNAEAAVCITNAGMGAWGTAATWSCGHVPTSADTVEITRNITLSATTTIAGLTVDAGATLSGNNRNLTVGGPVSISGTYNTGGGDLTTTGGGALTVDTGGTFDFNNGNASISGDVAIDGTLSSGGDAIQMTGASTTLSGSGSIDNTDVEIDALGISLPAGSTLDFANNAQLRVGNNNQATFTLDGAITTGATWTSGDRIVRVYQNSSMTINGFIDAPDAYIRMEQNASITNNGTVAVQYLRTDAASSVWTQGNDSSLVTTLTAPAGDWNGVLDASATGNTVTYDGTSTPLAPSSSYYNLAGTAVTCPHGFVVQNSDPCVIPPGGTGSVTLSPSNCMNVTGIGTRAWTNPARAVSSNNSYATVSLDDGQVSQYLRCTGYGFTIPAGATITGITVNVERRAGTANRLQDAAMRLVKDVTGTATIQVTDRSTATFYPTTEATEAHGGTTDLWGDVWTPDDINSANFGAALASQKPGTLNRGITASVDHMPITVTYTVGGAGPHHIEIDHDGGGLTCSAETVTIKACADAACTTLYTAGGLSVTLSPGGQVFTIDATGINSAASVKQLTTGSATLSAVSDPAATDATPTTCWNTATSTASCAMTFSDSGFVVTAPDHVSCNNASVTIEAVQTAPGTGRCVPAYQSVTRAVNLYTAYTSPVTGTMAASASADGGANWFSVSTAAPGVAQNLAFDATGKATILLNYQDAGKLTLNATGTAPTGKAMTGSGTFVVAPASFVFSGVTVGPIKAGANFSATVTAMNNCATPAATPNFGKETSPESAILSFSKCQPTGTNAVNGSFTGSVGAFSGGGATAANLNWSEVGNGDLVATNSTYLDSSLTVTGNTSASGTVCKDASGTPIAGNVGSFIPDHFDTTVADGCAGCGFTYSGQPFTVTVTAMNGLATPTKTANYDGTVNTTPNFANAVSLTDANAAATPVGKFGLSATPMSVTVNGAGDTLTVPKDDFVSGVATLNSVPAYIFNVAPTTPTVVAVRAVDSVNASVSSSGFGEGTTAIRSGRITLANGHGSELLPLPLTAAVQFWNGTFWVNSATDAVTTLQASDFALVFPAGTVVKPNNLAACETVLTLTGASPTFTLELGAPGNGNNGWADLTLNLGAVAAGSHCVVAAGGAATTANYPWLQFPAGTNPTARATFGVYRGNDEFIYLRENY